MSWGEASEEMAEEMAMESGWKTVKGSGMPKEEDYKYAIHDIVIDDITIGHIVINNTYSEIANELIKVSQTLSISSNTGPQKRKIKVKRVTQVADLFFKTEPCRNQFNGKGRCSYGVKCKFAHTDTEIKENQERCSKTVAFI
jgi:hypothetical protein